MSTQETFAEQVRRVAKTCKQTKRHLVAELLESNRIISLDTRQIIALGNEVEGLKKRIQELNEFVRDVRDNWDCDTGANGAHHSHCRACSALKLLPKEENK